MICCPSAVNKCPFKRTYYSIFGKECFIFGYIICCPFKMKCLAPYTVPLGPNHGTVYHGTVYHGTVYHGTVYHGAVHHGTVYHGTVYHGPVNRGTVYCL